MGFDGEVLYNTVMEKGAGMCGVYPAAAGLTAAAKVGAISGRLKEHTASAAVSGDSIRVTDCAGVIIKRPEGGQTYES